MPEIKIEDKDFSFYGRSLSMEIEEFKGLFDQAKWCFMFSKTIGVDARGKEKRASVYVFNYMKRLKFLSIPAATFYIWYDGRLFKEKDYSQIAELLTNLQERHNYLKEQE